MKRVVRLDELSPDQRRLVFALIANANAPKPEAAPLPHRKDGTAPSKEQGT